MTSRETSVRDYEIRLDDGRWVTVSASVAWDRGQRVYVERITEVDGSETSWRSLGLSQRRRLIDDLGLAENIRPWAGGTTCKHEHYLLREFCLACLSEARATP